MLSRKTEPVKEKLLREAYSLNPAIDSGARPVYSWNPRSRVSRRASLRDGVRRSTNAGVQVFPALQALLSDELDQVNDAHRVTPLVVIPGQYFDQIAVQHLGHLRIDDGTGRVMKHVGGHNGVFCVSQDPFHGPVGCVFQRTVYFFRGRALG